MWSNDVYILVRRDIDIIGHRWPEDSDLGMPMHNLIEYSSN